MSVANCKLPVLVQDPKKKFTTRCKSNSNITTHSNKISIRRNLIITSTILSLTTYIENAIAATAPKYEYMEGIKDKDYGKTRMRFSDFELRESGLQIQELFSANGKKEVKEGDEILMDWDGYTIGYYGRPFEAKNKAKGGAFVKEDEDYLKVKVGAHEIIPGIEEALYGMREGSIRRLIVPVELGYPNNEFDDIGPKPSTFSGQRALSFVLKNRDLIDKTLLFDVKVVKILN